MKTLISTKKLFKAFNFFLEIKINIYKINNKFLILKKIKKYIYK